MLNISFTSLDFAKFSDFISFLKGTSIAIQKNIQLR